MVCRYRQTAGDVRLCHTWMSATSATWGHLLHYCCLRGRGGNISAGDMQHAEDMLCCWLFHARSRQFRRQQYLRLLQCMQVAHVSLVEFERHSVANHYSS